MTFIAIKVSITKSKDRLCLNFFGYCKILLNTVRISSIILLNFVPKMLLDNSKSDSVSY
jgi:hypothetical protein